MKRLSVNILAVLSLFLLAGCGSSSESVEEKVKPLPASEIADIKTNFNLLNINVDKFEKETVKLSSLVEDVCSGHSYWITANVYQDDGVDATIHLSAVDNIADKINEPSGMKYILGEKVVKISSADPKLGSSQNCGGFVWSYQSTTSLLRSDLDNLIAASSNVQTDYRLLAGQYNSGFRDFKLNSTQSAANLEILKLIRAIWEHDMNLSDFS